MQWEVELDLERPGMSWWERLWGRDWDPNETLADAIEGWLNGQTLR